VVADLRGSSRPTGASVPDALVLLGEKGDPSRDPMNPLVEGLGMGAGMIALIVCLVPVEMAIKGGGTLLAAVIIGLGAVMVLKATGIARVEVVISAVVIDPAETVIKVVEVSVLETAVIRAAVIDPAETVIKVVEASALEVAVIRAVVIDPVETVIKVVEASALEAAVIRAAAEATGSAIISRAALHEIKSSGTLALDPVLRMCVPSHETAAETNARGASGALTPPRGPSTMAVPTGPRATIPRLTGAGSLRLLEKLGSSPKDGGGDREP
jgi:hypothetical protein